MTTPQEIADFVSKENNNDTMNGSFRLFAQVFMRAGIKMELPEEKKTQKVPNGAY